MSIAPVQNTISIKEALSSIDSLTQDLPKTTRALARRELKSLLKSLFDQQDYIEIDTLRHFLVGFKDALETGNGTELIKPRGLKVKKIADVQEFVESKFFLGMKGDVWPSVMDDLWNIFHGPNSEYITEVVLGGAVGTGKSVRAELGLAYLLYIQSCYHDPQAENGLAAGTSIYFVFQSISLSLAKKVLFEQFSQRLRKSPYFTRYFPFNKEITTMLKFPNNINILPIASQDTSALGLAVISGAIDECNFQARVLNSAKARYTGDSEYDAAEKLYATLARRLKSRFHRAGKMPGKLFLMSSANYPEDFISRKIAEAHELDRLGEINHIYVSSRSIWEAKPQGTYSDEKFPVEIGDSTRRSRVLTGVSDAIDPDSVVWVPIDFKNDFLTRCEDSIRDLIGIPIGSSGAFLKCREKIYDAAKLHVKTFNGLSLFKPKNVDLSYFQTNVGAILNEEFLGNWVDPLAEYYCHCDLSLSNDSTGICIAHLGGYKEVGKSFEYDEGQRKYVEVKGGVKPIVIVDGVLEVVSGVEEIDLNLLATLLEIISQRLNLVYVTADSYQSASLLQRMRKTFNLKGRRIKSAMLSVDTSPSAYMTLKQNFIDECILIPDHEKLQYELREIQYDPVKNKVDHRPELSKDISDSLAGASYLVTTIGTKSRNLNKSGDGQNTFRRIRSGRKRLN